VDDELLSCFRLIEAKLDGLIAKSAETSAKVDQLGLEVASNTRAMKAITDEASALHQAQIAFDQALALFQAEMKIRTSNYDTVIAELQLSRSPSRPPPRRGQE
jgi:3-deoxy-D-manno-octulosonic-acid transferase